MKTRETQNQGSSKARRRLVIGALIAAPLTGAMLTGATAQREDRQPSSATEFPFVTLTRSQHVHLNASNTANPPDGADPPGDRPGPTCRVLFRLFDSEGRVVATATSSLPPGKTGQMDPTNAEPSPTADPPGVRGEISVPAGKCTEAVLGSMEIIDTASGEVRAIIAPTNMLRVPQVDAPDTTPPRD